MVAFLGGGGGGLSLHQNSLHGSDLPTPLFGNAKISKAPGHTTSLFEGNLYTMIKLEREGSFSQNNNDKKLCARRNLEKLICNCFPNVNDRDTTLKYRLI